MAYQNASRVLAAIHRESSPGVQATATGAYQMRVIDSSGLVLNRAQVQSAEKRRDGLMEGMRLGYKTVEGEFVSELSVGGATDLMLEALMRAAWATATSIGFATMTDITTTTNAIVAGGGDWGAQGVKVGDVFNLLNHNQAANNSTNLRALAVTSLTISVATGALVASVSADATGTLTILKKLSTPSVPVPYSHTIEQYDMDVDESELFLGAKLVGGRFSFRPGQMATITTRWMAIDSSQLASGASPYFDGPTLTTSLQLVADDSTIRMNGVPVASFTGLDLNFEINAAGVPVIGSLTTPQIFENDLGVSGQITALRSSFANLTMYNAETEFSISVLLQEPSGSPRQCISIYLARVKIAAASAPFGGGDGAKIETLDIRVMPKTADAFNNGGIGSIQSSAA